MILRATLILLALAWHLTLAAADTVIPSGVGRQASSRQVTFRSGYLAFSSSAFAAKA